MKMISTVLILMILGLSPAIVLAGCKYKGQEYPTGTNIGGVVCQPNGTWR